MNIRHASLVLAVASILLLCLATPSLADDEDDGQAGTLPASVEEAITAVLASCGCHADGVPATDAPPAQRDLDAIMAFSDDVRSGAVKGHVLPAKRSSGTGAFYQTRIALPLGRLASYCANPHVPSAAIYPTTVRRNAWKNTGTPAAGWRRLTGSAKGPAGNVVLRGVESEETTPDTSSGCVYRYDLERLFVLTRHKGRAALLSVTHMPQESSFGAMGLPIDERTWSYVYTDRIGTNMMFAGWAKTRIYGSAGVTVMTEDEDGRSVTVTAYKYTKAGWSGMNMVKPHHIVEGMKRFYDGLRSVVEHPRCPSPTELADMAGRISALDDAALRDMVRPFAERMRSADLRAVRRSPYREALENYADTLSREHLAAEAIRLRMRERLGID